MRIIDKIIEYFNRRKQLKLDKPKEERINDLKEKIIKRTEEIFRDEQYSSEQKKYEAIYILLKQNLDEAIELEIIEKREINQLSELFKENKDIQDAITFVQKDEIERKITYKLDYLMDTKEFAKLVDEYIKQFFLDKNKLKVFTEYEKFNIIKQILEKKVPEDMLEEKLLLLKSVYENSYFSKIIMENNPREAVRLYKEYVSEFLGNNPELENQFRCEFSEDKDILRRIDLIQELGMSTEFNTMEKVPIFFDMTRESVDQEANEEVAKRKINQDITAEDLLFIRTTQVFPKDGIVEHIGQYSEVETIGNPFMEALRKIEPGIKESDFEVLAPRFRWTSHWCVNGVVGDHTQGTFSNRDFFIIEDASEHTENAGLLNMLVADTIFLGDMKLSSKAQVMMSIEKYQELMQNPQMKKQLSKTNIILYKGNPYEALKMYMNERDCVYGKMSSFSYVAGGEYNPEYQYLAKIEKALKEGKVNGFEHCAYTSDESLSLSEMRNPQLALDKVAEINKDTYEMRGLRENKERLTSTSIYAMSKVIDDMLTYNTFERYLEYLGEMFPEMQCLNLEFIKARQENEPTKFWEISETIIRKVGLEKIKSATKEFNKVIKEEQKKARAQKDKELLDAGLITQQEYNDRMMDCKTEKMLEI